MPNLTEAIFIGLFVFLMILWFLAPILPELLGHGPREGASAYSKRGRNVGALIAGLVSGAVGLVLLAVSLADGIEILGLAGALVFFGIGVAGVLNGKGAFNRRATS